MSVIYAIKNLVNNKVYIGSSKSPKRRKAEHFYQLKKGNHHSIHLQRSYEKYGKDSFAFYILEECDDLVRKEREIFNIEKFNSYSRDYGYNVSEPNGSKFKCSESTKFKSSKSNPNKIKVDLYTVDGEFVETYPSIHECNRQCGFPKKCAWILCSIIKGIRKCYKGYVVVKHGEPFTYKRSSKSRDMSKFRK